MKSRLLSDICHSSFRAVCVGMLIFAAMSLHGAPSESQPGGGGGFGGPGGGGGPGGLGRGGVPGGRDYDIPSLPERRRSVPERRPSQIPVTLTDPTPGEPSDPRFDQPSEPRLWDEYPNEFPRDIPIVVPADHPGIPIDETQFMPAQPFGGTVGIAGGGFEVGRGVGAAGASAAVMDSDLPREVKSVLNSQSHQDFMNRCQPAAQALEEWRLQVSENAVGTVSLEDAMRQLDAVEKIQLAKKFKNYAEACLSPWRSTGDTRFKSFIEARIGLLRTRDGKPLCTATLILGHAILTARHCVKHPQRETWTRDFSRLTFSRLIEPETHIPLSGESVRMEYYSSQPGLGFDRYELQSDIVILGLSRPISAQAGINWDALAIVSSPPRYAQLHAVTFNMYGYLASRMIGDSSRWQDHVYIDDSALCMVAGRLGPRLILHACQTEVAASGAPLMLISESGSLAISAVHTGSFSRFARLERIWDEVGIDTRLVPNHGVIVDGPVKQWILR